MIDRQNGLWYGSYCERKEINMMTEKNILWESFGFKIEMKETTRRDNRGLNFYSYSFWDNDFDDIEDPIFKGEDYSPAPAIRDNEDRIISDLIGFLSLSLEDTDFEHFNDYTNRQMRWCISQRIDDLKIEGMELEERND